MFSKHLLISWLQLPSAVIMESKKIKSVTVSILSPSECVDNEVFLLLMGIQLKQSARTHKREISGHSQEIVFQPILLSM